MWQPEAAAEVEAGEQNYYNSNLQVGRGCKDAISLLAGQQGLI
jgi:hypothetical protein